MPTTVEIPVHATVDAAALAAGGQGDGQTADAVRAATGRAIVTGLREAVPGGGAARPVLAVPEITWSGDFEAVDAAGRGQLERGVLAGLAGAVADAGLIGATAAAAGAAAAPTPDAPAPSGGFAQPPAAWTDEDFVLALLRAHLRTGRAPVDGVIGLMYADGIADGHAVYGITLFLTDPDFHLVSVAVTARGRWFHAVEVSGEGDVTYRDADLSAADDIQVQTHTGSPAELHALRVERLARSIARRFPDRPEDQRRALARAVDRLAPDPGERGLLEYTVGAASYLASLDEQWRQFVPPGAAVPVIALQGADLGAGDTIPEKPFQAIGSEMAQPIEPTECEPYEHEPPIGDLGAGGELLRRAIAQLAAMIGIEPCPYAGRFALAAATRVAAGAADAGLSESVFPARYVAADGGSAGAVDFRAAVTDPILQLQRLAGVLPHISALRRDIARVYLAPEHAHRFAGQQLWIQRYEPALAAGMRRAAGGIFISACRETLHQLLKGSQGAIEYRLKHVDGLAAAFEVAVAGPLTALEELHRLRSALSFDAGLKAVADAAMGTAEPRAPGANPRAQWEAARDNLLAVCRYLEDGTPRRLSHPDAPLVEWRGGRPKARDSQGRWWTREELDEAIPLRRALLDEVDPLVRQLTDIEGFLEGAERDGMASELRSRLEVMAEENAGQRTNTKLNRLHGFRAGRLTAGLPGVTFEGVVLQGVHLEAHALIEGAFAGERAYPDGLRALFAAQEVLDESIGYAQMLLLIGGSLALAMACPPAAAPIIGLLGSAAGLQIALEEVEEQESLYRALIHPEMVVDGLQIEQARFDAWTEFWIGSVLSFLPAPELETLLGAAGLSDELIEALAPNLVARLVYDEAADLVVEQLLREVTEPVVGRLRLDVEVEAP